MSYQINEKDDSDPLILPDGRVAWIKYCFIRSQDKPRIGDIGFFDIDVKTVLWSNGKVSECMTFPNLEELCKVAAMLPCGPERAKVRDQYLRARKCMYHQMEGHVRLVEPAGASAVLLGSPDWVIGVEKASSLEFDTAIASAGPENWYQQAKERNAAALGDPVPDERPDPAKKMIRGRVERILSAEKSHGAPSPMDKVVGYFRNRGTAPRPK